MIDPLITSNLVVSKNYIEIKNLEKTLLTIDEKGIVEAPDLESASEAGKAFVESLKSNIKLFLNELERRKLELIHSLVVQNNIREENDLAKGILKIIESKNE